MERTSRPLFAIYGASGCGRGVMPVAARMLDLQLGADAYELVFVDDADGPSRINGRRRLSYDEFRSEPAASRKVSIAIANSVVRQRLAERCASDGIEAFAVRSDSTVVMDDVELGEGAILSPFVTLTSNIRIGRHFHCNLYSYVEHDCSIGDFVTFGPGVHCNGNIVVEDFAYLGAACVIKQGLPGKPLIIGRGATVGMGAVVTSSVAPGTTVVGNPARVLTQAEGRSRRC